MPSKLTIGIVGAVLVIVGAVVIGFIFFHHTSQPEVPVIETQVPATTTPAVLQTTHTIVGSSVQGRPIDAYTYGSGDTHVMFVGGMHGGYEWNSVLLAYYFMDYLKEHPETIPKNETIVVIPSANPDGVFKVIGKEGRFTLADAPAKADPTGVGRTNADDVDLNRNFDCNWQATSTWQSKIVSAGTAPFSEPEAQAIKAAVEKYHPVSVVFWHSQSGSVYASECHDGVLPKTVAIMNAYAHAAHYTAVKSFDAYPITGDSEGWLASIGIPALTVELTTHTGVEWTKNLLGIQALLKYFSTDTE